MVRNVVYELKGSELGISLIHLFFERWLGGLVWGVLTF